MTFEDLAAQAGAAAAEVGRRAHQPPFGSLVAALRRANFAFGAAVATVFALIVVGTAVLWPGSGPPTPIVGAPETPTTTIAPPTTVTHTLESCPVTVPGDEPFIPPSATPEGPPPSYESVWYGTPELWTRIHVEGEVWDALPVAADGTLTQKTFWWREGFDMIEEGQPEITVTMELVGGSAGPITAPGPATSGSHPELGQFMIQGIQIPELGCWRITGEYRGTTLSYVVWADGR